MLKVKGDYDFELNFKPIISCDLIYIYINYIVLFKIFNFILKINLSYYFYFIFIKICKWLINLYNYLKIITYEINNWYFKFDIKIIFVLL